MIEEKEGLAVGNSEPETKPSRSNSGLTSFHRRLPSLPQDTKQHFKWLIYDNNGSYNGLFDWLPLWMRVGYWSPFVVLSLVSLYIAIFFFKPQPLEFPATALDKLDEEDTHYFMGMPRETGIDLFIFLWGIVVAVSAKLSAGSISGSICYLMSFTGWSWLLLTCRAGLEFMAWVAATHDNNDLASKFAIVGSSIRLVTIINASVVCTIYNFILLPMFCLKIPTRERRRKFLKFNFGFTMTNIHLLNFPLAFVNILNGSRVRLFTMSDLWVAYFVILLYSAFYFFVMDRLGMHFYPILNPRTAFSVVSILCLLGLYYFLFLKWNEYVSLHANV